MKYRKLIISWLNLCIATISILVLVGGITRLTDSGLSITEWNLVGGVWYPSNQEMIEKFDKYRASSEFKIFRDSSTFTLDDFKFIFFWEYFHRILGRIIGILFSIPLLYLIIIKAIPKKEIERFVDIFLLIGLQGLVGWFMVRTGLGEEGRVSAIFLSIHLILALLILALIYWNKLRIQFKSTKNKNSNYNKIINQLIGIFFIQVVFGALCSGLDIGKDFLKIGFIDIFLFNIKENIPYLIQLGHIIIGTIFIVNVMYFSKNSIDSKFFKYSNALSYISITQYFIGVMNIIYAVPVFFGILHQFLVMIILILIIRLKYFIMFET